MKITLDNQGSEEGFVLVTANWAEARIDQSIEGSRWEHEGDMAYASIPDQPDLVLKLEAEGYEVDDDLYYPPD